MPVKKDSAEKAKAKTEKVEADPKIQEYLKNRIGGMPADMVKGRLWDTVKQDGVLIGYVLFGSRKTQVSVADANGVEARLDITTNAQADAAVKRLAEVGERKAAAKAEKDAAAKAKAEKAKAKAEKEAAAETAES